MDSSVFDYDGYKIPVPLVNITGGGTDSWEAISKLHLREYEKYCQIGPNHTVLEPGCGVGRDAISLSHVLSKNGRYIGYDIIKPSIDWATANITPRFPNFTFFYLDIQSQIHNPDGKSKTTQFQLPVESSSVDRIVLHSVFTHMFEDDITHYLSEFRRVLKPNGLVMASLFVLDPETLLMARSGDGPLRFDHRHEDGCYINDTDHPEGAVGFTEAAVKRMLERSGMELDQPIHRGFWSGRKGVDDGQDIMVLRKGKLALKHQIHRALKRVQSTRQAA